MTKQVKSKRFNTPSADYSSVGCTNGNSSICLLELCWMLLALSSGSPIWPQAVPSCILPYTWRHRPFLHALMNITCCQINCGLFYLHVSSLTNDNWDTNSESDNLERLIEDGTTLKWVSGHWVSHSGVQCHTILVNLLCKKGDEWTPKSSHIEALRSHRGIQILCWCSFYRQKLAE